MRRVAVFIAFVLMLACAPAIVAAQGLLAPGLPGLPGLPSLGGFLGSTPSGCDDPPKLVAPLAFYVGWMEDRQGGSIGANTQDVALGGIVNFQHRFPVSGVWFGLSQAVNFSDKFGIVASGWYLVPTNRDSTEDYLGAGEQPIRPVRTWDTESKWWYVDGLAVLGAPCTGITLLAGCRYDEYSVRFKNPKTTGGVVSLPTDKADATLYSIIPLVGTQFGYSGAAGNLVFRAVGFPAVLGNGKYAQTFGGANRLDASGTYRRGYFIEFFTEYSKKFGPGNIGIFARYNNIHVDSSANVDLKPVAIWGTTDYDFAATRSSWTVGGVFGLDFSLPFL